MKPSFAGIALACVTGACGGFAEDRGEPSVLVTLEGEMSNPKNVEAPELRVALVWTGGTYNVAQDLEVVPRFPVRYTLQIDRLPPEDAFLTGGEVPPGARVAVGSVVGYVDQNGNARLDMVDIGAESYVDRLVAANSDLLIAYVEATDEALDIVEARTGIRPPRGFSLYQPTEEVGTLPIFLPIEAGYNLELDPDPRLNAMMCRSGADDLPSGSGGPVRDHDEQPASYPSPDDPNLTCGPGGTTYTIQSCEEPEVGPCRATFTRCVYDIWRRPEPIPAGWPCTG
jgi:hypothetical protein